MKYIKTVICALCAFALALPSCAAGWYCRHTTDGAIPDCPPEFSFLEKCDGFYLNEKAAEAGEKVVYLTFDAGYENGNVEKVLDVLKEKNVTGAFFVLENLIVRNEELVRRMGDEGHLVCNHTAKHKNITRISEEEINKEIDSLESVGKEHGIEVAHYFRPPEGELDEKSASYVSSLGYKTVMWSFAYADWDNAKQMSPDRAKKKILDSVHCGEIMLLHPTSATNAAVLGDVIDELKSQGYRFGSLTELE